MESDIIVGPADVISLQCHYRYISHNELGYAAVTYNPLKIRTKCFLHCAMFPSWTQHSKYQRSAGWELGIASHVAEKKEKVS